MKRRRTGISTWLLLTCGLVSFAQDIPPELMERFNAQKVAFFTERLKLTPKEAQVFWPVYNEYQDKKNQVIRERKELIRSLVQSQRSLSDKEVESLGDQYVQSVKREAELLVVYHEKFKEILPIQKVVRIYNTEIQFKNFLLRQIQQNRQGREPAPR